MGLPPFSIIVRCILDTVIVEALYHLVQYAMPHLLKPFGLTKPLYDCGADRVVCMNERSAQHCLCQRVISETTQRPNLRTVVGSVHACCHIAALAVTVVIRSEHAGVAGSSFIAFGISVGVAAEQSRIRVSCFAAVVIVVVVATK